MGKQNMAMFEEAMRMFNPFRGPGASPPGGANGQEPPKAERLTSTADVLAVLDRLNRGGRTLVLFNGRRLPDSPVPLVGVDVNLLPLGAIERVEVLKDGAAAQARLGEGKQFGKIVLTP